MIYILSGKKGSGKTTALHNFSKNKIGMGGILSPEINGERFFLDVSSGKTIPMETNGTETELFLMGRFNFRASAFEEAEKIILKSISENKVTVIDEVGPLEIRLHKGFDDLLKKIFCKNADLIVVVRIGLTDEFLAKYDPPQYQFITKDNLLATVF